MNWSVTAQFNTLNPEVGATEVPDWGGVTECTEAEARHFFHMWVSTRRCVNCTVVLWEDDKIVDVKFVK